MAAMQAFADFTQHGQVTKLRALVSQWLNPSRCTTAVCSTCRTPMVAASPRRIHCLSPRPLWTFAAQAVGQKIMKGARKQVRPLAVQHSLYDLQKKLPADDLHGPPEVPAPPDAPERKHKMMCGQARSSFTLFRWIKDLKIRPHSFCVACNEQETLKECVCISLAASTHRKFLVCQSTGNDPCVRVFLLEVQQQRNTDLQTQLLPHRYLRTGYLRC